MVERQLTPLKGIVEVDEAYVGGKPRHGTGPHKRGRGTKKAPIVVLVERDGSARCKPVENVTAKTLKAEIRDTVDSKSTIMTDEYQVYTGIGKEFEGGHRVIKHRNKEYSRTDADGTPVNTNTAESFFSLIKRGHMGVYHVMSKKHLHRYCTEFAFRWDRRKVSDKARMEDAMRGIEGKRLLYQTPDQQEN